MDSINIKMEEWTCVGCGCVMAMPADVNKTLRKSHKTFYCINGHGQLYPETKEEKSIEALESKLVGEYAKNAQLEGQLKDALARVEELEKGVVDKIRDFFKK